MFTIYKYEMRIYVKSLLIWILCVGGLGLACILLFSGMQEEMEGMAESFASMGAFSDAFGMNQLSIGTLSGYYATEVGTIHGLGGAMFAAIISTTMLSKEEDGHTGEFLFSLPVSRGKVVMAKWCAVVTHIALFNLLCVAFYLFGIVLLGEEIPAGEFFLYHSMQLVMQTELAALCFCISAFLKKNRPGLGLGIVLFLYAFDLMARVIPDLSDAGRLTPFSYANAPDILSGKEVPASSAVLGVFILLIAVGLSLWRYNGRDLAS